MRRIKSAPANLATMSNKNRNIDKSIIASRKENNLNTKSRNINISLLSYLNTKKNYYNNNNNNKKYNKQNSEFNKNSLIDYFQRKNDLKKNDLTKNDLQSDLTNISNLLTDITIDSNNFSLEESSLIYTFIMFLNENVLKKDKIKEFYSFIVKALIRYHVMLFIHIYVLHDKIDNIAKIVNAINSDDIVINTLNTLNTLPFHIN